MVANWREGLKKSVKFVSCILYLRTIPFLKESSSRWNWISISRRVEEKRGEWKRPRVLPFLSRDSEYELRHVARRVCSSDCDETFHDERIFFPVETNVLRDRKSRASIFRRRFFQLACSTIHAPCTRPVSLSFFIFFIYNRDYRQIITTVQSVEKIGHIWNIIL